MTKRIFHIILFLMVWAYTAMAQTPRFVMLAEPFSHTVTVNPAGPVPQKGQVLGNFEILEVTADGAAKDNASCTLLLVAYDTGSFSLSRVFPPDTLNKANTISIRVTAPPEESIRNYAPPREILFPEEKDNWPLKWPLIITVAVAIIALIYALLNRKKKTSVLPALTHNGTALLHQVKAQWMGGYLDSLQLGEGLVNSLQAQLGVPAKKSTRQFLKVIRKHNGSLADASLQNTLQQCDAWRFGKQIATHDAGMQAIGQLEKLFTGLQPNVNKEA